MILSKKRLSFRAKLIMALVLPILIVLPASYVLLNRTLTDVFQDFQIEGGRLRAGEIQKILANYYANRGSWEGVDALIHSQYQSLEEQVAGRSVLLATPDGRVIASATGELEGQRLDSEALAEGVPIEVDGHRVGVLLVGPVVENFSARESAFLQTVHRSLLITGLVGFLFAILVALLLFSQVLRPLRRVTHAVRGIRAGNLDQRVPVETSDELGALADAFNEMADHLKRSEEVRRNMVTDVAHELRTPITAVQCTLEAMLAGAQEPTLENLAPIYDQTLLLTRLVHDLQELYLAEARELRLQKTPIDLAKILHRMGVATRPQLEEVGITLTVEVPAELPPVEADGERIEQVLHNLLSNAQRYTPAGGQIRVAAQASDGHLLVSVSDTGSGIPPEELPFVFQRFYRGDRSRSRATGGAGLGLAIAKQLVEAHGGLICAESQLGRGTTFRVMLPLTGEGDQKKEPVISKRGRR